MAKYVDFKKGADTLIVALNDKIEHLEQVLIKEQELVFEFEKVQIPNLKSQISILREKNNASERILNIKEDYFKEEKKRLRRGKLTFGIVGTAIGIIIGVLAL